MELEFWHDSNSILHFGGIHLHLPSLDDKAQKIHGWRVEATFIHLNVKFVFQEPLQYQMGTLKVLLLNLGKD